MPEHTKTRAAWIGDVCVEASYAALFLTMLSLSVIFVLNMIQWGTVLLASGNVRWFSGCVVLSSLALVFTGWMSAVLRMTCMNILELWNHRS